MILLSNSLNRRKYADTHSLAAGIKYRINSRGIGSIGSKVTIMDQVFEIEYAADRFEISTLIASCVSTSVQYHSRYCRKGISYMEATYRRALGADQPCWLEDTKQSLPS